ncbi:LOW QUALITY PROTEIN: protein LONGIFOLIA 1-like [Rutidosis leptorrhynchoides]|uniref:LOW QUALITY PROTEIN: protein LONGIFOLIA 1-like n=1 Tax=Rutidosis leptorrhynchoides TaxID=125765 RepID=UPI003A9995DE
MAAKLLHSLADENPDLQKQIGCMTGIFQLFDRHNSLHTKRLPHKRLPNPTGCILTKYFHYNGIDRESSSVYYPTTASETSLNKSTSERQRASTESSRPSCSSSCSSSMSSLECNKITQPESSPFDRIIFPETPSRDQSINSPRLGRQSLDLRDVVKDSMYRDGKVLPVKLRRATKDQEAAGRAMKHRDSPRPLQLSKSVNDQSHGFGNIDGTTPVDLKESLRALAKLREAPWYSNNYNYSTEIGDSKAKDAPPRFSYDGTGRDTIKTTTKLKELPPRLSLDSKVRSLRDSKSNSGQSTGNSNDNIPPPPGSGTRPTSVVAKLMGLEVLPDSAKVNHFSLVKTNYVEDADIRIPHRSPRSSLRDPVSPKGKNPDIMMKPISSSKVASEPAPWRQSSDGISQKSAFRSVKVPVKAQNSFPSVYSEIEKRLKDLEFNQSGKDLRALKQILEAMQVKGLLESKKEEQREYEPKCHNTSQRNPPRTYESPIVVMKPAKLVEKSGLTNNRTSKEMSPRNNISTDNRSSVRNSRTTNSSSKESNNTSSMKGSGSVSPRLQQKKLESEKRSRPPTPLPPLSDSNRPRRQQSDRRSTESGSPVRKVRPTKSNQQKNDVDQLQVSNESGSVISWKSVMDEEVTSTQSPSITTLKIQSPRMDENGLRELAIVAPEHPSPVSVLDASLYRDDEPSPVKGNHQLELVFKDTHTEMNRKKLENIEHLVEKLRRVNSGHDEAKTDYIASLSENTNPDDRYISEILLASGLLLRDVGSFQLHASGHPINPELFLVLEQTKASKEFFNKKGAYSKPDPEKSHRKLIFDAVNEILVGKLDFSQQPWLNSAIKKRLNSQKLLKELCSEIQLLQAVKPQFCLEEEEEDSLKHILFEDVNRRTGSWKDFQGELPSIVLDVERLLFKDLVDEIVHAEAATLRNKPTRRRQLFTSAQKH